MAKSITVDFTTRLAKFEAGINKANAKLTGFQQKAQRNAQLMGTAFRALGPIIASAFTISSVRNALDFADGVANAAEQTGFTTKRIQELRFAAGQTDISINTLDSAMARFAKRLGLARRGAGAAAKEYKQFGINLNQTNEQVFQEVVGILGNMTDETDRLALATRFFGDDAQRMGVLLAAGNQGLKTFADQAADLGLIIDDEIAQNASKANDAISVLSQTVKAKFTIALASLAPIIIKFANAITELFSPKEKNFVFGDELEENKRRIAEIDAELQNPIGSTRAWQRRSAELNAELRKLEVINPYVVQEAALRRIAELESKRGERTRTLSRRGPSGVSSELERQRELLKQASDAIEEYRVAGEAGAASTDVQSNALDKMRASLEAANNAANTYAQTMKLFKGDTEKTFREGASDAEKISQTFRLVSQATSAAKSGDDDAAGKVEKAAAAINAIKESGLLAEQSVTDLKNRLGEVFTEKPPEVKVKTVVDEDGLTTYTDEATQKMQAAFDANPPIVKVKVEVDEVAKAVEEAVSASAVCTQAEKVGGKS